MLQGGGACGGDKCVSLGGGEEKGDLKEQRRQAKPQGSENRTGPEKKRDSLLPGRRR